MKRDGQDAFFNDEKAVDNYHQNVVKKNVIGKRSIKKKVYFCPLFRSEMRELCDGYVGRLVTI